MSHQNTKLINSGLVDVPEIEGSKGCVYFNKKIGTKELCESCYAKGLWYVRKNTFKGIRKTPKRGVCRLGTWSEILPEDYKKFKELFPTRKFFLITRGLLNPNFYNKLNNDPCCLNIQISVDWHEVAGYIPNVHKVKWFLSLPKVLLRFKTTHENVERFTCLKSILNIGNNRILETPLRTRSNGIKLYQTSPMNKIGQAGHFLCNSKCVDCSSTGNNKMLVCARKMVAYDN